MKHLYLLTIENKHPEVMAVYRYVVLASSVAQAEDYISSDIDGKWTEYCFIVSCERMESLGDNVWYLRHNESTPL